MVTNCTKQEIYNSIPPHLLSNAQPLPKQQSPPIPASHPILVAQHGVVWLGTSLWPVGVSWMFKGRVPSTHHAADTVWSELHSIPLWDRTGNPSHPGIWEVIMDWPEGKDFGLSLEEEMTHAEEAPLHHNLPENEKQYALFTGKS